MLDTGSSIHSIFMVIRCSYFNKPLFSNMLMVFVTIIFILIITDIDNVKGIRMRLLEDIKPVNEILFLSHL